MVEIGREVYPGPVGSRTSIANGATVDLALLGGLTATSNGRAIRFRLSRSAALLAYLALAPAPPSRSTLATLLWSEVAEDRARTNLRVVLTELRALLGDHLVADRACVGLSPGAVTSDVATFEAKVARGDLDAAIATCSGPFLEGFHVSSAPVFDEWVDATRDRLVLLESAVLEQIARRCRYRGAWKEAAGMLARLVRRQPYDESHRRLLMDTLAQAGTPHAALAEYRRLLWFLGSEGTGDPEAATANLAASIASTLAAGRVPSARSSSVVAPSTPLFGRDGELHLIERLLSDPCQRLVTLTGIGGVGKTRLAQEIARRASTRYAAGTGTVAPLQSAALSHFAARGTSEPPEGGREVAFVQLASIESADYIASSIVAALGVTLSGMKPAAREVAALVGEHPLLLVADNMEHLLAGGASLIATLLDSCPRLTVLATSRSPLHLPSERVVVLRPFPVLPPGSGIDALRSDPAVALFVEHVTRRGVRHGLDDLEPIARICASCDGIPLAIELSAARVGVQPLATELSAGRVSMVPPSEPQDLAGVLPPSGIQDRTGRHSSLQACLAWSYDLLPQQAQELFIASGVFRGGVPVGALQAVTESNNVARVGDFHSSLHALVESGLVEVEDGPSGTRLSILETTRAFACQLAGEGGRLALCSRHAAHFLALAEETDPLLKGSGQLDALEVLRAELSNLRAALAFFDESGDGEGLARLAVALHWFFVLTGGLYEARGLLECALQRPPTPLNAARTQLALVDVRIRHRDVEGIGEILCKLDREFADGGDECRRVICAYLRGRLFVQSESDARSFGDHSPAWRDAVAVQQKAIAGFERLGEAWLAARTRADLAHLYILARDFAMARELADHANETFTRLGDGRSAAMALVTAGIASSEAGDLATAIGMYQRAFVDLRRFGDVNQAHGCLSALACALVNAGDAATAARYFGATSAIRKATGITTLKAYGEIISALVDKARSSLGRDEWNRAFEEGLRCGINVVI